MGRFRKQNGFYEHSFGKQCMMMTMQCTNSTRFSSSGFAGCHSSPAPPYIGGGGAPGEGSPSPTRFPWPAVEGEGLPPQVGFLLSLHQTKQLFDFSNWRLTFQTRI